MGSENRDSVNAAPGRAGRTPLSNADYPQIVVNDRGRVESVKTSSQPRTVGEWMMFTMSLHAIKSWEFRPALKDGRPLRYRRRLSFRQSIAKPLSPPS